MARFIIRFYSADNTQCAEIGVTGRKLSKKEVAQIGDELRPGEELYYISKKNEFALRWIIRYNGVLSFASYNIGQKYNRYKIIEA